MSAKWCTSSKDRNRDAKVLGAIQMKRLDAKIRAFRFFQRKAAIILLKGSGRFIAGL